MKLCFTILIIFLSKYCSSNAPESFFSSQQYEEKKYDGCSVTNDIWGGGAGHQEINATSCSSWCVKCSHPNTDGVKSYPHTAYLLNKPASSYKVIESSFNGTTTCTEGKWSFSYDIWLQKRKYEIMLWMYVQGKIQPVGSVSENNVMLGSFTWNVWRGNNGQNEVFSFVNLKPCWSGTVDIKATMEWLITKMKWIPEGESVVIDEIQHGFEITSTPDNAQFCMTALSVTAK